MKKTLLTLATAAMTMSSMAATTNTSTTTTSASIFDRVLEGTSASIAAGTEAKNNENNEVGSYVNLNLNKKFGDAASIRLAIRTSMTQSDKKDDKAAYRMIDPRLTISAFNTELATNLGKVTIAPALRIEAHTQDKYEGETATLRLGASASLETSAANTTSFSAHTYRTVTDPKTVNTSGAFYFTLNNSYAINDGNSISLMYEHFFSTDFQDSYTRSISSDNDITLTYSNTSLVKDLDISPFLSQELETGEKIAAIDFLELGLNLSYSF